MHGAVARALYSENGLVVCQQGCLSATGSVVDHLNTYQYRQHFAIHMSYI